MAKKGSIGASARESWKKIIKKNEMAVETEKRYTRREGKTKVDERRKEKRSAGRVGPNLAELKLNRIGYTPHKHTCERVRATVPHWNWNTYNDKPTKMERTGRKASERKTARFTSKRTEEKNNNHVGDEEEEKRTNSGSLCGFSLFKLHRYNYRFKGINCFFSVLSPSRTAHILSEVGEIVWILRTQKVWECGSSGSNAQQQQLHTLITTMKWKMNTASSTRKKNTTRSEQPMEHRDRKVEELCFCW